MKVQITSDQHLEMFPLALDHTDAQVLVLAGDIHTKARVDTVNWLAEHYPHIIYVPGNHEYYDGDLSATFQKLQSRLEDNIYLLNNNSVHLDGITFHGSTLWTSLQHKLASDEVVQLNAERYMNDFRYIRANNHVTRFSPQVWIEEHNRAVKYLKDNVEPGDVVVTHHLPSYKSVDVKYQNHPMPEYKILNAAFASDLDELVISLKASVWIHGHSHSSANYMLGDTNVIANPRGYLLQVDQGQQVPENLHYDPKLVIDV